jgi:hypothetical protein
MVKVDENARIRQPIVCSAYSTPLPTSRKDGLQRFG